MVAMDAALNWTNVGTNKKEKKRRIIIHHLEQPGDILGAGAGDVETGGNSLRLRMVGRRREPEFAEELEGPLLDDTTDVAVALPPPAE